MGGKKFTAFTLIAAFIFTGACIFKPSRYKGVISYRNGRVYIKHDKFYRVGRLSGGWERMRTRARTISFYNPEYRSSISTDASCVKGSSDRQLESLGGQLVSAIEGRVFISETPFDLDGRGALRQTVSGKMDGVQVYVDLVVVRKDGCVFDMYAVTPPDPDLQVKRDFEEFFGGFHYGE